MIHPAFVTAADVRTSELLVTSTAGRYSDAAIGSNIVAASEFIERVTGRWFANRPATTYVTTSQGATAVNLPGLRTATSISQQGVALVVDSTYYLVPDTQGSGVYTGLQLRGFGSRTDGPWYLGNPEWFDRNLDNPRYGGGWAYSLPNDVSVTGDWGYLDVDLPYALKLATKALAAWYTKRPDALLANVALTPDGTVLNYADLPPETSEFIAAWKLSGPAAVSVG